MKPRIDIIPAVVALVVCLFVKPERSATQVRLSTQEEHQHYVWLFERLQETYSVKAGMTKADLLKIYTPDGGLQHSQPQGFVLRSCSLIKVDVMFDAPEGTTLSNPPPDSELRIKAISKPYLEPMYVD